MNDPMLPLPGLSSASGKPVVVKFDGGLLSSDGDVLALREVEQRLRVANWLAACMIDPRAADQITHSLADVIRFRLLMISAGDEDGNDANALRRDPMFKMALDLSPIDRELCSQSTVSRLENLPDVRAVLRMGRAMVDLYCESFATIPKRITLDIDDTFDAVHGGQQLRLFNAHYDEYGFQPIVVFDGEGRFVAAVLRPAKWPSGKEIKPFLRRLLRAIRAHWPTTEILLRADSHYCMRSAMNAIFYLLRTGCPWRYLPGRDLSAAFDGLQHLPRLPARGRVGEDLGGTARGPARTAGAGGEPQRRRHRQPVAQVGRKGGCAKGEADAVGYDASKKVKGRKSHALVDTEGLPLRVVVHSAAIQDRDGSALVLDRIRQRFNWLELVWADGGYNARQVEHAVAAQPPLRVEIVKRPDDSAGFIVLPRRWVVERTFSWFGRNHRLAKDYENLADALAAFITLACIQLAVGRLARP